VPRAFEGEEAFEGKNMIKSSIQMQNIMKTGPTKATKLRKYLKVPRAYESLAGPGSTHPHL
jgi:hypothetical protein